MNAIIKKSKQEIPPDIKGVLIDLDNTLYEYSPCHHYALRQCHKRFRTAHKISFEQFVKKYDKAKKTVKKQLHDQAASHSRLLYFQTLLENHFGKTYGDLTLEFEKLYWESFSKKMRLHPWVKKFLAKCKKNGIKICVITDMTAAIQLWKIELMRLGDYIDFVVSSEEAGADKPDRKIFQKAINKIGIEPNYLVMIGDDKKKDYGGAKKMGIRTILIKHQWSGE